MSRGSGGDWSGCFRFFKGVRGFGKSGALTVMLVLLGGGPDGAEAQIERTFGIHLGQARGRQLWSGPLETSTVNGLSVGLNVDVPTPAKPLSIRVGLGYVRRGSRVQDPDEDPALAVAEVRSHYLTVPVHGKLRFGFGPFHAHAFGGPVVDQLLETQCSASLCRVFQEEQPTTISVSGGMGLAADVQDRFRIEGEFAVTEGLSEAYRAGTEGIRYRTVEVTIRLAFPF